MSSEFEDRIALRPADPRRIPEITLYTLVKGARRAEARVRQVFAGRPELRFYVSGSSGALDLVWSQVMTDGLAVGAFADQKRGEFEAKGWTLGTGCRSTLRLSR